MLGPGLYMLAGVIARVNVVWVNVWVNVVWVKVWVNARSLSMGHSRRGRFIENFVPLIMVTSAYYEQEMTFENIKWFIK